MSESCNSERSPPATGSAATVKKRKKRKLDERTRTEICAMISVGCSVRTAARLAGCSDTAIRKAARSDSDFGERLREAAVQRESMTRRRIINDGYAGWLTRNKIVRRKSQAVTPAIIREVKKLFIAHLFQRGAR